MILLIDNYDSFSYNLVQLIGGILKDENSDEEIKVVRNDEITIDEVKALKPSHLILSPGPGRPADAGICEAVIPEMMKTTPILGVCLGHQAICETFGATITYAQTLMHGKKSIINMEDDEIFKGLDSNVQVASFSRAMADTIMDILFISPIIEVHQYGRQDIRESSLNRGNDKTE